MSDNVGSIHYVLTLNTREFAKSVNSISSKLDSVGNKMKSVGTRMTLGLTVPIVAGMGLAVKRASDLQETMNVVNVTFQDSAKEVTDWSKNSIERMGLAQQSALDMAGTFGAMGLGMGQSSDASAEMAMNLTKLSGDMASFKNISADRASVALAGIYTGETEALKGLGIIMTQARLKTFAMNKGITKNIEDMTQAELIQLRYNLVMEDTNFLHDDYINTADSTANKTRTLTEKFKELTAQIGQKLQPYADKLLDWADDLIDKFDELSPSTQNLLVTLAGITATAGPLVLGLGMVATSISALIPLMANPVFWIVAGVFALIAGAVYLIYKNWETIKNYYENNLKPMWEDLKEKLLPVKETAEELWITFKYKVLPVFKELWSFIENQIKIAIEDLEDSFKSLEQSLGPLGPYIKEGLIMALKLLVVVIASAVASIALLVSFLGLLVAGIARVIGAIASFIGWIGQLAYSLGHNLANAVNRALGFLGNMWNVMWNAGSNLISGLASGISSGFSRARDAVINGMSAIRRLLPFSPAKEGPFSGAGWTLYSGRSMMEGLAQGIKDTSSLPQMAIEKAMGNASYTLNGGAPASSVNNSSVNINGDIQLGDQSAVNEFFGRLNRNNELTQKGMATV